MGLFRDAGNASTDDLARMISRQAETIGSMGEHIGYLKGRIDKLDLDRQVQAAAQTQQAGALDDLRKELDGLRAATERHVARVNARLPMPGFAEPADETEKTVTVTMKYRKVNGRDEVKLTSEPTPDEIGTHILVQTLRALLRHYEKQIVAEHEQRGREMQAAANQQMAQAEARCACGRVAASACSAGGDCTMLRYGI